MTENRGGYRPGAGRKAKDGPTVRLSVKVPVIWKTQLRDQATAKGLGLSERIREILKAAVD